MPMQFFAHSAPERSDWEPLHVHLQEVASRAGRFGAKFGAADLASLAGLLHDLGKYDPLFQRRLAGEPFRHDHSIGGAKVACMQFNAVGKLLAPAIAGHHAGLADWYSGAEQQRTPLSDRLTATTGAEILLRFSEADGLRLPSVPAPPAFKPSAAGGFQRAFLARMLFSCLVDADFLATEAFYAGIEGWVPDRGASLDLADLKQRLDEFMAAKLQAAPETAVNRLRAEILAHVRAGAGQAPGLFTLTVPTGGGKTLASLAFALDHAERHGHERVVVVIPYTSIIEQTAGVFRTALDLEAHDPALLEHHSAFDLEDAASGKREPRESRNKLRLAMENWDAPVVVTTAVQFFESLFADRPSRCRKLHRLARSVVVIDEAQTMPHKLLRPCVSALDELARNYGTSIVLCTATQPALQETDDRQRSFHGGFRSAHELAPNPPSLFQALERVSLEHAGTLDDEAVVLRLAQSDQALCIVNTRSHARALFERARDLLGARHLSTLMCAAHRREVLAAVRADLAAGRPCRVISTSLIEAGVDVDFSLVLRAEAGLDQIAQAAGRCNREGGRNKAESWVVVFKPADAFTPSQIAQLAAASREVLRDGFDNPFGPDAVRRYFERVFWAKSPRSAGHADELDAFGIMDKCRSGQLEYPFETIARAFRLIEDRHVPVIVPRDDRARATLRALRRAEQIGGLARQLQSYTVGVPRLVRQHLLAAGAAQFVSPELFGEQFVQLTHEALYREDVGLTWDAPIFRQAEDLPV